MRNKVIANSNKPAVVAMATEEESIKWVPAAASIAVGLIVKFLVPVPAGLTVQVRSCLVKQSGSYRDQLISMRAPHGL